MHVYKGKEAAGTEAATLHATVGAKGEWSVAPASELPDETYTVVASEPSTIGNTEGLSEKSTFIIFTRPPTVVITKPPEGRSNKTKPAFEGEASETEPVSVHIYEGTTTSGKEVVPALKATVSEGKWHVTATTELAEGKYTAVAVEPSSIENASGESKAVQFEIVTRPPTVTMEALIPRSKENTPNFKGTASEPGQVTVHVYKGKEDKGTEAAKLQATVGPKGEWSVPTTTALPDETYTAVATEPSAIGNAQGESASDTFEIFTKPPTVEITSGPSALSNKNLPSFEGKASETEPVVVHIHEGSATGPEVMPPLKATVSEDKWHVVATSTLKDGEYTAVATEPSSIGNAEGESNPWQTFVIRTVPPSLKCTRRVQVRRNDAVVQRLVERIRDRRSHGGGCRNRRTSTDAVRSLLRQRLVDRAHRDAVPGRLQGAGHPDEQHRKWAGDL